MAMIGRVDKTPLGIYIHIPFCRSKCRYCDFYSATAPRAGQEAYVATLTRDLIARAKMAEGKTVDTVYFGGGTPSLLPPSDIALLLDTVRGHYDLAQGAEVTMECNPHSAVAGDLSALRHAGVNRLSIGLQSAIDTELAALGRPHDFADFEKRRGNGAVYYFYGIPILGEFPNFWFFQEGL
jgi:oxygen-independent coproporphyrinogen-3 oxidase